MARILTLQGEITSDGLLHVDLPPDAPRGHVILMLQESPFRDSPAPTPPEVDVQEAAEVLSYPLGHVQDLLQRGEIPSRGHGKDRKISLDALLDYKRRDLERRRRILSDLTEEAQEMGLY